MSQVVTYVTPLLSALPAEEGALSMNLNFTKVHATIATEVMRRNNP